MADHLECPVVPAEPDRRDERAPVLPIRRQHRQARARRAERAHPLEPIHQVTESRSNTTNTSGSWGLSRAARASSGPVAVAKADRGRFPPAADPHALNAHVPTGDHLAFAELELERAAAIPGRVEFVTGRERDADVVDADLRAARRLGPVADDEVLDHELERGTSPSRLRDLRALGRQAAASSRLDELEQRSVT